METIFPFTSPNEWDDSQFRIWRTKIAMRPTILDAYDSSIPIIIYGAPGSGVTTALEMIRIYERERGNLVVHWEPHIDVFSSAVSSVVEAIAQEFVTRSYNARKGNEPFIQLSDSILTVWFWLLATYFYKADIPLTQWWFERHLKIKDTTGYDSFALDKEVRSNFRVLALLTDVVNALGYDEIICFTDHLNEAGIADLQTWFRDVTFQEQLGLKTVSGMNTAQVTSFPSKRVRRLGLTWEWAVLWQLCNRMLEVALGYPVEVPSTLRVSLQALIESELGKTPRGIKTVAHTLYWLCQKSETVPNDVDLIKRHLYEFGIKLDYNSETEAIHRGLHCLKGLNDIYLRVFKYLYQRRNICVTRQELMDYFEVNSIYLDQIISRIRAIIEPKFQKKARRQWIYLHNVHGWGYELRLQF